MSRLALSVLVAAALTGGFANSSSAGGLLDNTTIWAGGDAYKSIGDRITNINGGTGSLTGSFGAVAGFNSGIGADDSPIHGQFGASYGLYDFKGRLALVPNADKPEQQVFVTGGFYKPGDMEKKKDRLSWGVVYDYFHAEQWGVNGNTINLGQVRGVVGYALNQRTEIGLLGTLATTTDQAAVTVAGAPGVRRAIRAMTQANFYVKQNFALGAQVTAYAGVLGGADIDAWQVGMQAQAPLTPKWSAYGNFTYVVSRSDAGPKGSGEEQFNASVGLSYNFGGKAQSPTVTGSAGLPLLNVANNGSFLITD